MTRQTLGNQKDICDAAGLSPGRISQLKKQKHPGLVKIGKLYDIKATVAALKAYGIGVESEHSRKKHAPKKTRTTTSLGVDEKQQEYSEENKPSELSLKLGLDELEKIKLYEQARKLNIANNLEEGKLINAEENERLLFNAARKIRDTILKIPSIVSAIVPDDIRHEVEILADKQIKEALEILVGEISRVE